MYDIKQDNNKNQYVPNFVLQGGDLIFKVGTSFKGGKCGLKAIVVSDELQKCMQFMFVNVLCISNGIIMYMCATAIYS